VFICWLKWRARFNVHVFEQAVISIHLPLIMELIILSHNYTTNVLVRPQRYFFLISATTHVESWLSQQFSSIRGGLELVPIISGVSSFVGHYWHRHSIFVWVFLLVELHMAAISVYFVPYWFQVFYGCVQTNSVFGI
jgi:hypothetical protein